MPAIKSTIRGIATDPAGAVLPGATVEIRAATPNRQYGAEVAYVPIDDSEIVGPLTVSALPNGAWKAVLFGTADIAPAGTVYIATWKAKGRKSDPIFFDLPNDGGNYWIGDRLVGGPAGPPRTLVSIVITPAGATIAPGATVNFRAIGTYDDATTADITTACTWAGTNNAVATVSNAAGTKGRVTGVDDGGLGVTATDPTTSIQGGTLVAVVDTAPPPFKFIAGSQVRYMGTITRDLDEMKADGCTWVRMAIDMAVVGAAGNTGSPTAGIDLSIGGASWPIIYAKTIGLNVLASVAYSPTWLTGAGGYHLIPQNGSQRTMWNALLVALMHSSLFDYVDALEIWNEPNHFPFNGTGTALSPGLVPDMATIRPFMHDALIAAHGERAGIPAGPGGPASARTRTAARIAKYDDFTAASAPTDLSLAPGHYIGELYQAGGIVGGGTGGASADFMTVHGYTGDFDPAINQFESPLYHSFIKMPNVGSIAAWGSTGGISNGFSYRDLMVAAGDGAKKIWATEQGFFGGGPGLSLAQANTYAAKAWGQWRDWQEIGWAGPYFNFEHYNHGLSNKADDTPQGTGKEDYLGMRIVYPDGTRKDKPQLATLRGMLA